MPDRFYITTAIAYANSKPGVHTLYEVIGADALARWQRMRGTPTRFLTGTDEHSVNIAMRAGEEGRTPRDFVDEKVALYREAEDALFISPDRFIRTTDPDHVRAAQEMVRRAHANGDIYVGTYEGWYCPNEGFRNATDVVETSGRDDLPEPPGGPAPVADREELVLPAVGLPGAPRALVRGAPGLRPARLPAQRDAGLHPRRPRGLLDQPRRGGVGDPVPRPSRRLGRSPPRRHLGPGRRDDLRLVRRPHQLHHGGGLSRRRGHGRAMVAGGPPRDRQGHRPLPHDLLAGHAVVRGARGAPPRLGPWLAPRAGRADEQEPGQLPRPARLRGRVRRRRRPLRGASRGPLRSRHRRHLGQLRPSLQRRPRQRLRQPRQPDGLDGGALSRWGASRGPAGGRGAARGGLDVHAGARGREARRLPDPRGAGDALGLRGGREQDGRHRGAVAPCQGRHGRRRGCGGPARATSSATCWRPAAWWPSRPPR